MLQLLRTYGLALACVAFVAGLRFALVPVLGYRPSIGAFLVSVFLCGRYLGFGPSLFALALGVVPGVLLQILTPANVLDTPPVEAAVVVYLFLGSIIAVACKSEHEARSKLKREIAERRSVEAELRESQQRLLLALEAGKLGAWELDLHTNRVKWSGLMAPIHGFAPGEFGGTLDEAMARVAPEDRRPMMEKLLQLPSSATPLAMTYRVILPDGGIRWVEGIGKRLPTHLNSPAQVLGVCRDVTERHEAETALRQAEERFRTLALHAPVGIFQTDLAGRCTYVNEKWCEIADEQPADALGKSWHTYIHPDDLQRFREEWQSSVRDERPFLCEVRLAHPPAEVRWVIGSATAMRDAAGAVTGFIGTAVDISDRKRAIEALESEQELLRHTIQLQDQERQLISYEVHDGLVQYATGALMQLQALRDKTPDAELAREFEPVLGVLQKAVAEGRRVVNGIRTPVLDDGGIVAALEYLIEEEDRVHVAIEFVKPDDLARIAPHVEEALFRIAQEALTNARKHSRTEKLRIELKRQSDRVRLEICDWGVGFSPAVQNKGVHGIKSMHERARIAGGQCTIESAPGSGTIVVVDLPYEPRQ